MPSGRLSGQLMPTGVSGAQHLGRSDELRSRDEGEVFCLTAGGKKTLENMDGKNQGRDMEEKGVK